MTHQNIHKNYFDFFFLNGVNSVDICDEFMAVSFRKYWVVWLNVCSSLVRDC